MNTQKGMLPLPAMWAEFIGTFALVFAGCGAVMSDVAYGGGVGHVGIALTFGLVVMVMIFATGHVSGAHFNPAVSIAFWAIGRFPLRQVPAYVATQCVAAIAAVALLRSVYGDVGTYGQTVPVEAASSFASIGFEVVLTFFLMFVITAVATDDRAEGQLAGVAIGGTVALCALFGGPVTGASMNPARSLGPALFSGELGVLWIYIVGPILGAVLGALSYTFLRD
ncbi:MAG: MIP family channel protein [Myxococcota bacterium]